MKSNLFLPEPHTVFYFCYHWRRTRPLGSFGSSIHIYIIFQRGIKIAKQTTDPFGIMLSIGIVLSMVLYTFINVGYVTGVLPVTGLPIPLISHGGKQFSNYSFNAWNIT